MRVLVTGGVGFIGSHVVDALVAAGHDVRVVDSLHPRAHAQKPDYLHADVEYHWVDLADLEATRDAVTGVDAVCHQASMVGLGRDFTDIDAYVRDNDLATAILLRALHERGFDGRFVLASSMTVYGEGRYRCPDHGVARPAPRTRQALEAGAFDPACSGCGATLEPEPIAEDAPTSPRSVYAATKLHQEHLSATFGRDHDLPVTCLRYHNVYGPRMPRDTPYAGVAAIFRSDLEACRAPRVFEDGQQLRDFIHIDDIATANILALEAHTPHHGPLNIASGRPRTVLDMATTLRRAFDDATPQPVIVGGGRPGDVRHIFADTCAAREAFGFTATTDFATGVACFARAPLRASVTLGWAAKSTHPRPWKARSSWP